MSVSRLDTLVGDCGVGDIGDGDGDLTIQAIMKKNHLKTCIN